jgi:hypothetical protein
MDRCSERLEVKLDVSSQERDSKTHVDLLIDIHQATWSFWTYHSIVSNLAKVEFTLRAANERGGSVAEVKVGVRVRSLPSTCS